MIKIIKEKEIAGVFQIEVEFTLFGSTPIVDVATRKTKEAISYYWNDIKRSVILINFERHILEVCEGMEEVTDGREKGMERLHAANKYFNDPDNNLTTEKICDMIVKLQSILMSTLPSQKNPRYYTLFSQVNELVKICKL